VTQSLDNDRVVMTEKAAPEGSGFPRGDRFLTSVLTRYPMVLFLVLLLVAATIAYPSFWSPINLVNIVTQNVGLLLCCLGMTYVIIGGGFDLSVGSVYAAGGMVYISFIGHQPAWVAVIGSIALCAVMGLVNGLVVNLLRVNTFVATLGSASIFIGLITLYAGSNGAFNASQEFTYLGNAMVGGFPLSGWIALILVLIAGVVLSNTSFGRSVYAIGGNREAARLSGIRVGLVSTATFVIIGALSALGGIFTASQLGTATPSFVGNITLNAIAIVIIGGTALTGGEGAIWRTMIGIAIMAVLGNLFTSLNFQTELQTVLTGVIVVGAVAMDVWVIRRR
jgi:ribose transport system permease protein